MKTLVMVGYVATVTVNMLLIGQIMTIVAKNGKEGNKIMSEITVITTIEVTKVYKGVKECFEIDKTKYGDCMKNRIKKRESADDVVVTNVQVFEKVDADE